MLMSFVEIDGLIVLLVVIKCTANAFVYKIFPTMIFVAAVYNRRLALCGVVMASGAEFVRKIEFWLAHIKHLKSYKSEQQ